MIINDEGLPKKIENPKEEYIGACANVTVIYYPDGGDNYFTELSDVDTLADIVTIENGFMTLLAESPLHGAVYRYNNHGGFWEKVGITCGYA